ncbi:hypothetical protein GL272_22275 [Aeromonas veronii]|uniref:hypothetical protein n=1 Tax=Aeromonas veronii TaxID=654 RepID=UPI001C5ADCE2|nr:hypothetical protein [Aeromonas veronii]MBW3779601.1 hypothetical protein [Aeromonas veronii]
MGSISEEFKDQKINILLEDYIALEKKIHGIPEQLSTSLKEVEQAISLLPHNLSECIEVIAKAVENSETTANELNSTLQQNLEENHKATIGEFQKELNTSIFKNIDNINNELDRVAKNVKESTDNLIWKKVRTTNMILGVSLCFSLILLSASLATCYQFKVNAEKMRTYAQYILERQQTGLASLTPAEQRKFNQAIENATDKK